jgi:hypothetical protein
MGKRSAYMVMALKEMFGGTPLKGAEIGVFQGVHAEIILQTLNMELLYLVDPYDVRDPDFAGHSKPLVEGAREIAERRLAPYRERLIWLFVKSDVAVGFIDEGELDFVYIDGNHSYGYVARDIKNYLPLIKVGGWLGGHDYVMRSSPLIEVKRAVDDFVAESGFVLNISSGKFPEWWVRKVC